MTEKIKTVNCPTCGKPVEWRPENKYRPFCSERCKLIDLGEWATEKYRVPTQDGGLDEEPADGTM
ncbi:MAG TPA: DNA gyrase inhibitor YacG [Parasulfuritortus sp.]